ncbi:MAG: phosphomannomutase, partial [Alphaproteobacteria bacterium]|nr:phosphomannomutase [Alphaproteobacteria bacterium]
MKKKTFRAYDIRGVVEEDFSTGDIVQLGKAFGSLLEGHKNQKVIIGRDGRLSSPNLSDAFIEGLMSSGLTVLDCGLVPTPLLYFSAYHAKANGAVMITGSHNPPNHNGFKMMLKGKPLCGLDLQHLYFLLKNKKFKIKKGSKKFVDFSKEYLDFLLGDFQQNYGSSSLKVAWDTGNGAAGPIIAKLLQGLPGVHYHINERIDGLFPAHPPDPTEPDNVKQLAHSVKQKQCDVGIASVVDPEGQLIWADQLLPLFAAEILETRQGAFILADVKSSYLLKNTISDLGGNLVLCPCGHSQIKIKMKEICSPLACEMSGHI